MEIYFTTSRKSDAQEVTTKVTAIATKKLNSLKKYLEHRKSVAKVYVELGKVSEAHQQGNVWRVQINLDCDGKRFHATSTGEKPETALGASISELENELRKSKQYHRTMMVKGGAVLKDLARGFEELAS